MTLESDLLNFSEILEFRGISKNYIPLDFNTSLSFGFDWLKNSFDLKDCLTLDFSDNICKKTFICINSDNEIILYKEFSNYSSVKEFNINNLPKKYKNNVLKILKEIY